MLLVVRPYGDWIRGSLFGALRSAGIDTQHARILDGEVRDEEVAAALLREQPQVLLLPYHTRRDGDRIVSGLATFRALVERNVLPRRLPTLMPVTVFAAYAFERERRRFDPDVAERFREQVLVLPAPFVDPDEVVPQIRAHTERLAARGRAARP